MMYLLEGQTFSAINAKNQFLGLKNEFDQKKATKKFERK